MSTLTEIVRAHPNHRRLTLKGRARFMRNHPTLSEQALWARIKSKQLLGVQFRRQVVIANFIADFYACSVRLIVEVDGGYHASRVQLDAKRVRKLRRAGYHVVTLSHELVIRQPELAVATVRQALVELGVSG